MKTKAKRQSAGADILLLVGVFLAFTCLAPLFMPQANRLVTGLIVTVLYLATHCLATALARTILRTPLTQGRILASAVAAFLLYCSVPVLPVLFMAKTVPVAMLAALAFTGAAITLAMLICSEEFAEPSKPASALKPVGTARNTPVYPYIPPVDTGVDRLTQGKADAPEPQQTFRSPPPSRDQRLDLEDRSRR